MLISPKYPIFPNCAPIANPINIRDDLFSDVIINNRFLKKKQTHDANNK